MQERGWSGKKNGELLRAAAREFDAFITMDSNLQHQQNLSDLDLAIVVLKAQSNAYSVIAPLIPEVNRILTDLRPGEIRHVQS